MKREALTQVKATVETLSNQNQGYIELLEEVVKIKGAIIRDSGPMSLHIENQRLQDEVKDLTEQCQNLQTLLTSVGKTVNETTAVNQQSKEHVIIKYNFCFLFCLF